MRLAAAIVILTAGVATMASATSIHPIINSSQEVYGASQGTKWINDAATAKRLKGGEKYTYYSFSSRVGIGVGSKPTADDHCPGTTMIDAKAPDNAVIGIDAPWNALPRKPRVESVKQPLYAKVVVDYLKSQHMPRPKVEVTQIIRCDVDGKGVDSVFITAKYETLWPEEHATADFYVVLMRRLLHGKVVTIPLMGDVAHKADAFRFPVRCAVKGFYDLKGDGKMEILIDAHYQDSSMSYIFAVKGSKAKPVLTTGCSA